MNIININSTVEITTSVCNLVKAIIDLQDETNNTQFLRAFSLKKTMNTVPILLVDEDTFIKYHRTKEYYRLCFYFTKVASQDEKRGDLSIFSFNTTYTLFDKEVEVILICPERIVTSYDEYDTDIFAAAIVYAIADYVLGYYSNSQIELMFDSKIALSAAIMLLYVRLYNDSLFSKISDILSNLNHRNDRYNLYLDEEFENYQNRSKIAHDDRLRLRLAGFFGKLNLADNDHKVRENDTYVWRKIQSELITLKNGDTFRFEDLNENILVELFFMYLDMIDSVRVDSNIERSTYTSNLSDIIDNIGHEILKTTDLYDLEDVTDNER